MSLVIKAATTSPVRIELDLDTDAGRVKGHFTGHAKIRSKGELKEFSERINELADDGVENSESIILHEMYERFDGLENAQGELKGDAAFDEVLTGKLSAHLTRAALEAYWAHLTGAREGNALPRRAR